MTNKDMAQAVFDYFGQGNVPAILDLVTDDIKWTHRDTALCTGLQRKKRSRRIFQAHLCKQGFSPI